MSDAVWPYLESLLPSLHRVLRLELRPGDVLIHAPGFEDRTMAVAEVIVPKATVPAVLLEYSPFNRENRLPAVRDALSAKGILIASEDVIEYNRFDPCDFEMRLEGRLRTHDPQRAVVDISTMSKLEIMLVLQVCEHAGVPVRILYAEPREYAPSQDEFERARDAKEIHRPSLQVYSGVHGVVRVDSLASVAMQGQPTAALVFMSFNDVLTQVLLNSVCPSRLLLINGRPPVHSWREAATAWIHDQVRREWTEDNPVGNETSLGIPMPMRAVSTLHYEETVSLLLDLYWQLWTDHRILLAPAGSKLQAVGCYLVKAIHRDIHIEYPSPAGFLASFSGGIGPKWLLDLGLISDLVSSIVAGERRQYLQLRQASNLEEM